MHIPIALREATWIHYNGRVFECECKISWCKNTITPFTYHVGNQYTIDEFTLLSKPTTDIPIKRNLFIRLFTCN